MINLNLNRDSKVRAASSHQQRDSKVNGISEAALVGSEKVIHNKDIDQLLDFFGASSWEKIK